MALVRDSLAVGVVSAAQQNYDTSNKQNYSMPIVEVIVRVTAITTNVGVSVFTSLDAVNYVAAYVDAVPMTSAKARRIIFSAASAAGVPAESATADSTITQPPILEPFVRVQLNPSGSATASVDVLYSDPSK